MGTHTAPLVATLGALLVALAAAACGGAEFEAGEPQDAGIDHTTVGNLDATLDGPESKDATEELGLVAALSWAQWPMPNSPVDVEAGAPNPETYTDNGDGTVTDGVTGLTWEQTPTASSGTYPAFPWVADAGVTTATTYCAGLTLGGHRDWRVPTIIELASIVDPTVSNPSIDETYFPGTPVVTFWSSTPSATSAGEAWGASFDYGGTGYGDETTMGWVRCVR